MNSNNNILYFALGFALCRALTGRRVHSKKKKSNSHFHGKQDDGIDDFYSSNRIYGNDFRIGNR